MSTMQKSSSQRGKVNILMSPLKVGITIIQNHSQWPMFENGSFWGIEIAFSVQWMSYFNNFLKKGTKYELWEIARISSTCIWNNEGCCNCNVTALCLVCYAVLSEMSFLLIFKVRVFRIGTHSDQVTGWSNEYKAKFLGKKGNVGQWCLITNLAVAMPT